MKNLIQKLKQPLYLILMIEIISVFLIASGILPRETAWPLMLLSIIFIVLFESKQGLFFFISSIPFFLAMPVTETFDYMSSWRILLSVLFISWFFKKYFKDKKRLTEEIKNIFSQKFIILSITMLILAILSLFNAISITIGIKKILFFINIGMLYILVVGTIKNKQDLLDLFKTVVFSNFWFVAIGFMQFAITFKYPLQEFWQFWSKNIIVALYGKNLSSLLQVSNSWFSYYKNSLPTLRMFSVFPDTHSFALIGVLGIPSLLILIFYYWENIKIRNILIFIYILTILSIILSGSRGIWLSVFFPLVGLILFYLIYKKYWNHKIAKFVISSFVIFAILFPFSTFIFLLTQPKESSNIEEKTNTFLVFERAKSISNLEETSNKGRLDIWKKSFFSIAKRPFLGVGIGNYPIVLNLELFTAKQGASAHNIYLDIASEMGIFSLFIFIVIFILILQDAFNVLKYTRNDFFYLFAFTFIIYILWILCYSVFDVVLFNDKVLMLFVINLGLLYSIKNIEKT